MASGKTSVGRELARITGSPFLDLDVLIEERSGMTVAEIFATQGEAEFRRMERKTLAEVAELENCVVALGGGVLVDGGNREVVMASGQLVILDVRPETVRRRVEGQPGKRPLLERDDMERLWESRRGAYDCGDLRIDTDGLSVGEVVRTVLHHGDFALPQRTDARVTFRRETPAGTVIVGRGIMEGLRESSMVDQEPFIVADGITGPLFADRLGRRKGFARLPRGEAAKTLEHVSGLSRAFSEARVDRSCTVLALGGGTVGDTAGFAAATWMRGVGLIQCPTTLLAQVDSSIGGKVGVNLPEGKNLVGAFYQPRLVLADVNCLASLSWKDYRQGLGEVVKYGLGEDPDFLGWLEEHVSGLRDRDPDVLTETVARCAGLKLAVVAEDEKERTGARARLILGHTVGHALEAASDYLAWQHGDGVAVGMVVATRLACMTGDCDDGTLDRLMGLLTGLGLPRVPDRPWEEILPHLVKDKKFEGGNVRLVLPRTGERSRLRSDVSLNRLREAYEEVIKWKGN
jgi:3-dehydroquinate synthase